MRKKTRRAAWGRRELLAATLAVALLLTASAAGTQEASLPDLDAQLEPLRSQFNADVGKVRLILLLDPT